MFSRLPGCLLDKTVNREDPDLTAWTVLDYPWSVFLHDMAMPYVNCLPDTCLVVFKLSALKTSNTIFDIIIKADKTI